MNLGINAASKSVKPGHWNESHQAELEAIYAGRRFSRLPREDVHNFVHNMVALLST